MDFLLDPNIAYLILLAGVLLSLLAIVTPGTGILEIGAFFCLATVGYAVYKLSFNFWAMLVLVLSVAPFIYAIQKPKRELWLGLSFLLLIVGSVFLFARDNGLPAVNPVVALVASVLVMGFLWFVVHKSIQAAMEHPKHDLGLLIGQLGDARTDIHAEGSVLVNGEMWSARSEQAISRGSQVRIVRREGFILVVEQEL